MTEYLAGDPQALSVKGICQLRKLWMARSEKRGWSLLKSLGRSEFRFFFDWVLLEKLFHFLIGMPFFGEEELLPTGSHLFSYTHLLRQLIENLCIGIDLHWIQLCKSKIYYENSDGVFYCNVVLLFMQREVKQVEKDNRKRFKAIRSKFRMFLNNTNKEQSTQRKSNILFYKLQLCVETFQKLSKK